MGYNVAESMIDPKCEHPKVKVESTVHRIRPKYEGGSVTLGYEMKAHIECSVCGTPFLFLGLPIGVSNETATTDEPGTELRAPVAPLDKVEPVYLSPAEEN